MLDRAWLPKRTRNKNVVSAIHDYGTDHAAMIFKTLNHLSRVESRHYDNSDG